MWLRSRDCTSWSWHGLLYAAINLGLHGLGLGLVIERLVLCLGLGRKRLGLVKRRID